MKFDIKHILIFGLALGMTSCVETMKDGDMSTGYLGVPVLDADILVEEFGATKAAPALPTLSVPDASTLHFKVTGSDNVVKWDQNGLWSTALKMPVGAYTIEVNYGSNTFGTPYYTGTCTGTISAVTEAVPAIGLSLCNSLLAVVLADDFTQHFTPSVGDCVTISSTSGSTSTTLGNYVFVPAGENLTIEVAGKSSTNEEKTLSWTLSQLSAATATYVTCSLTTTNAPAITMSEIPVADAWGNTAYVHLATTANISEANLAKMEYYASSNNWTDSVEGVIDGGSVKFTGLTPGATYKVRAQIGALYSNEVSMTMSTSALNMKNNAVHTYTSSELDGTDFTATFSVLDKFGVTASSLSLCKTDGTVLRTATLTGTTADWTSDGSTLTGAGSWPYLPKGDYVIKGTATQNGSEVNLGELTLTVDAPSFTVNTPSAHTNYDTYTNSGADAANNEDGSTIYGVGNNGVNISNNILQNANYSSLIGGYAYFIDGNSVNAGDHANQTWAYHNVEVKYTFDGVTATSAPLTCHVTGLPLQFTKKADYENSGWNCDASNNTNSTYSFYNNNQLTSPSFYFPKVTNVAVIINISPSSGTSGSFTCNSVNQTFTSSGGTKTFDITLDNLGKVTLKASISGSTLRYCKLDNTKVQYR
ncbi:MAG: hypothetical protein ACI4TU_02995 [Candidatus Cryptobacteroides sp.]